jgi:biopolymer transport protein ExbB
VLLNTREALAVPLPLLRQILDDLATGDVEAAQRRMEGNRSLLAQVLLPGLRLHDHPLERIHQAFESAGRRAVGALQQEVTYLANIGVLSPMLGLLGTTLGLMDTFVVLSAQQTEGSKAIMMSAAVGKGMVTTVVGLLLGIPAMASYYLLISRVGRIGDELEIASEEIYEALGEIKK